MKKKTYTTDELIEKFKKELKYMEQEVIEYVIDRYDSDIKDNIADEIDNDYNGKIDFNDIIHYSINEYYVELTLLINDTEFEMEFEVCNDEDEINQMTRFDSYICRTNNMITQLENGNF